MSVVLGVLDRLGQHYGSSVERDGNTYASEVRVLQRSLAGELHTRLGVMISFLEARHLNHCTFRSANLVSLGYDCLPRSLGARWGLLSARSGGYQSGPFDLAVHPPSAVLQLVRSGFDGYLDSANLRFEEHKNHVVDTYWGIDFNHEQGFAYAADDFDLLKRTYRRRISAFERKMAADGPLLLLLHSPSYIKDEQSHPAEFLELVEWLESRRSAPTRLLVLSTSSEMDPSVEVFGPSSQMIWHRERLPYEDYVWHRARDFCSAGGHEFERTFVEAAKSAWRLLLVESAEGQWRGSL